MTALHTLSLTDFRSYERLDFDLSGRSAYLYGPNGAGKTNLIEAISLLTPGRGLRNAAFADLGRRLPQESKGRLWGVVAQMGEGENASVLSTGADPRDPARRLVRLEQQTVPAGRLLDHIRLVWLTPVQDRLFLEARSERLRFFDRLVFAADPAHASAVSAYDKALRERLKLLTEGPFDEAWLNVLEARLTEAGEQMITRRQDAREALQAQIETHQGAFPKADLTLTWDNADLAAGFKASRARDRDAGRSLFGPHRTDLTVLHRNKNRPAAECSTGEQKALLLNLILAQGARLAALGGGSRPVLLLDEVAAHLDTTRRHALFDETHALGLQTLFTGTDLSLFEGLLGRALGVRVEAGQLTEFTE